MQSASHGIGFLAALYSAPWQRFGNRSASAMRRDTYQVPESPPRSTPPSPDPFSCQPINPSLLCRAEI